MIADFVARAVPEGSVYGEILVETEHAIGRQQVFRVLRELPIDPLGLFARHLWLGYERVVLSVWQAENGVTFDVNAVEASRASTEQCRETAATTAARRLAEYLYRSLGRVLIADSNRFR